LQTSRKVHCVAEDCTSSAITFLHLPNHRRPGIEADSHLWPETVLRFQARFRGLEPLQNRQRCATGPKRCVLERDRRAEYRHDAVASEVLNNAAVFAHAVGH